MNHVRTVGMNPEGESIKPEDENDKGEENGTKVECTIYIDTDTGTRVEEIKIGKRTEDEPEQEDK